MAETPLSIPFLDLRKLNAPYEAVFQRHFTDFLAAGRYIGGAHVTTFENAFAAFCGTTYCVGVGNGLDALTLILKGYIALGKLDKGAEVLVAANTFIATILSIKEAGATPILVEPDSATYTIDVAAIESQITEATQAIVVTHLYGQLADMESIQAIATKHDLLLICDAAQAHGATDVHGRVAGSLCDAASFSFYPAKNLGALGDAGAITTNNQELAKVVRCIANYGFSEKYVSDHEGVNSRLDTLQAILLTEKLKHLPEDNKKRRRIATQYLAEITNPKIQLPQWDRTKAHVFHLFVVRVADRAHFCSFLTRHGIGYLIHYPVPPHRQKALPELHSLQLPITEQLHREVVSIPLHPALTQQEIHTILTVLNRY